MRKSVVIRARMLSILTPDLTFFLLRVTSTNPFQFASISHRNRELWPVLSELPT